MTDHQKLKAICDEIGHESNKWIENRKEFWYEFWIEPNPCYSSADVREIIFTQEFMDKLWRYYQSIGGLDKFNELSWELLDNLDDPVSCLYDLITL